MALTENYIFHELLSSSVASLAVTNDSGRRKLSAVIELSHRDSEKWEKFMQRTAICFSPEKAIYAINYSSLFRWAIESAAHNSSDF